MADIKWIKLDVSLFDNRKIKQIRTLPEGDSLVVIWLQLLCLAGTINNCGVVTLTNEIPYTEQMLATAFGEPLTTVQLALSTFKSFGMIEIIDELIYISNWEKYQAVEGMELIKQQNRERQKKWYESHKKQPNVIPNVILTQPNATDKNKKKNRYKNNIPDFSMKEPKGNNIEQLRKEVFDG